MPIYVYWPHESSQVTFKVPLMQAQQTSFLNLLNGQVQYVVPRWQRRYRWGYSEIERLLEDLVTVAIAGDNATHYGGTVLTFPEPGPAGVVQVIRVVDGQQRLTTVSLLLACIAEVLGNERDCEGWTANLIRTGRLTNPGLDARHYRKLRLQQGDESEYRNVMDGLPIGIGAVSQAWRILQRLVRQNDVADLMKGLTRLQVVSIGLSAHEDPQQIFESINATGRPLTESEKVKNWLLLGLSDADQQDLHDNSWMSIESALGAKYSSTPIDEFLRDMLRWQTGQVVGIKNVYEELRRWALREGHAENRVDLCHLLERLSKLYGMITAQGKLHPHMGVRRQLEHLRLMGLDVHRPLTLRLLDEAESSVEPGSRYESLAECLSLISSWLTRLWASGRPNAGMNRAVTDLAFGRGPSADESATEYWLQRLHKLRNTRVGVPNDSAVAEGVRSRKAYGGSATATTRALLYALNDAMNPSGESIKIDDLTVEHIMPQKLTTAWKRYLGADADQVHGRYRDCLANLTLCGDGANSAAGSSSFNKKKKAYQHSPIHLTRTLERIAVWNEETLNNRADDITSRILKLWPWIDVGPNPVSGKQMKWRIDEGGWHDEELASEMVLNVASALLALEPGNRSKLTGNRTYHDLQEANNNQRPTNIATRLRVVPGHPDLLLYPYARDYPASGDRCVEMGQKCGVLVEVELPQPTQAMRFWAFLKEHTGGLPGQKRSWRGSTQWTSPINSEKDRVAMHVGNPDLVWLYIRAGELEESGTRTERMRRYSRLIEQEMGDQDLGDGLDQNARRGRSIFVQRDWIQDDEDEWSEIADWLAEQTNRLTEMVGMLDK